MKTGYVYIMTNKERGTLYIGVTSDPLRRGWQHKEKQVEGFTNRYNLDKFVWLEAHETIENAIAMEKKLKNLSRQKKIEIIERNNSDWQDLYIVLTGERSCAAPAALAG